MVSRYTFLPSPRSAISQVTTYSSTSNTPTTGQMKHYFSYTNNCALPILKIQIPKTQEHSEGVWANTVPFSTLISLTATVGRESTTHYCVTWCTLQTMWELNMYMPSWCYAGTSVRVSQYVCWSNWVLHNIQIFPCTCVVPNPRGRWITLLEWCYGSLLLLWFNIFIFSTCIFTSIAQLASMAVSPFPHYGKLALFSQYSKL